MYFLNKFEICQSKVQNKSLQISFKVKIQSFISSHCQIIFYEFNSRQLKDAVGVMCKKYTKQMDTSKSTSNIEEESDTKKALEEIMRQKSFLER